jgi:hypothetical protein
MAFRSGALTLTGCGLVFAQQSPEEAAIWRDYLVDDPPPRLFVFAGEIRDFATYRLEPSAGLEFWSEDPEYRPVAELDGQGRYTLRVDACRRDATFGDMVAETVLIGDNINCTRWIGKFAFRARQGTRCSASHRSDEETGRRDPRVLWLLDCQESGGRGHAWRPVKAGTSAGHP